MYLSLQACRAVAALLVVLFHLGGTFAQDKYFGFKAMDLAFSWGDAGVDFFFVLSGFLITLVHRRDVGCPQAFSRYVAKRTLRIYPTYWIVCVGVCVASVVVPALRQALPTDPWVFVKALLLIPQDPARVGGLGSPILFVAWSLQYEMMFYAVAGVAILNRAVGLVVALSLVLANLRCQFGDACSFPISFVGSDMIYLFAMGVAAAVFVRSPLRLPFPLWLAVAAAAAFVGVGAWEVAVGRDTLGVDRRLVFGALACVTIVALARAEDAGHLVVRQRWIALLGDSSYALYLVHIPVISLLCKLLVQRHVTDHGALVVAYIGVAFACVATAAMFHLWIERPLLAHLQRLGRTGRVGTVAGGTAAPVREARPTAVWLSGPHDGARGDAHGR